MTTPRGSSNAKNYDKDPSESDNAGSTPTSPASIAPRSAEDDASVYYQERQSRIATHNSKQRRSRKRWLGTLTIFSCCVGGCVLLRLRTVSIPTFKSTMSKTTVLTFDTWQDVTTQSAAAYKLQMNDREMIQQQDNEGLQNAVETKGPMNNLMRKKKKNKFAILKNKHRQRSFYPSTSSTTDTTVWDVNGPPVRLPDGITMKSRATVESPAPTTRRGAGGGDSTQQQVDSNLPIPKVPGVPLHASEALQCRDSVINFVINATDGKDECDGLIKAFDKTCSNDEEEATESGQRRHLEQRHRRHRRQRRLWDKLHVPYTIRLRALVYRTFMNLERLARYLCWLFGSADQSSLLFFAEDEVFKAWGDAQYLVENRLDGIVQSEARSTMYKDQCVLYEREAETRNRRKRQLDELVALDLEETTIAHSLATNKTKTTPSTTSSSTTSLHLPIKSQQHVSDKTANDALLLQKGEKIIKAANESIVAKEEAAKSKKSISDTADAVSSVLNDPTSVEARTCCASILNVYHELCSTDDEEQVSDTRLFFLVFVMACCGMVKSLIRHFKILWLPEAAGCILVGGTCKILDALTQYCVFG
jgi:hypothetical protein